MAQNAYIQDPNYVYASSIEEVEPPIQLLTFPNGFRFYSHSNPHEAQLIYNEIAVKQEYLPEEIKIDDKSCIFDVGANVGVFTLYLKSLYKGATVHAFEAINQTFSVLERNIALQDLQNVFAYNVAISDQDFEKRDFVYYIHLSGNSTSNPSIHDPYKDLMVNTIGQEQTDAFWEHTTQTVTTRTISSIIREKNIDHIDLIKIDVEGDELAVLRGIEDEHYRLIKQIALEVHSPDDLPIINTLFKDRGFTCFEKNSITQEGGAINLFAIR